MRRSMRFGAAALAAMLLLAACGGGDDDGGDEPETPETTETTEEPTEEPAGAAEVSIASFIFTPDPMEVAVGTEVTWSNRDSAPHTATADDGSFDTGNLEEGGTGSVTFDEAGEFPYHCAVHPDMTGTVIVA